MGEYKNKDFEFFVNNHMNLFKKYGHSFIVIKNQNILGVYDDVDKAIDETLKTEAMGTFIVQECTGDVSCYICTNMRFLIS
jgi:hypothetical protein